MTDSNRSNQSATTITPNMFQNYRLPPELGNVKFNISTQGSRKDRYCKAVTITLQDFADELAKPRVKPETHAQYLAMNREDQTNSKDVGGFVLGSLRKGLRNKNTVENLCGVALDADFAQPGMIDTIRYTMPYVTIVYSTRKHTPEKPRYRIIFMLKHPVSPEQHAAIARKLAEHIGIDMFDKTTFEPNRMMFFPSISSDSKFEYEVFGRELCDPDAVLAEYDDWRDSSKWPICPEEKRMVSGVVPSKQKDPLGKEGVIGAYNKTHTITRVLEEHGGDLYEPADMPNRWSYKKADSTAGVVIYEDKFFYSFHASDPNSCQLMNAFDLTRVLKFSDQDENSREATATTKLPSYKAMVAFAREDDEVKMMLAEQKAEKARMTFAAVEDDQGDGGDDENHAGNTADTTGTTDTTDATDTADTADVTANTSTAEGSPSAESGTAEVGKDGKDNKAGGEASTGKKKTNNAWKRKLEYDNMGNLKGSMYNAMLIFRNDDNLSSIVFNELTESLEIQGQVPWDHPSEMWRDQDDSQLIAYLELNYGSFSERIYKNALAKIADDRRYHPIRDYLNALPAWDGVLRVDRLLVACLGAADTPYVHAVTRKTLVAAVARVMNPGTKFDTILVMIGPQGCGKSTLVARLAQKWFNDSLMLTDTKDRTAPEKLQGYWILELGELAGLRKSDLETLKGFISRQNDIFRAAYGRRSTPHMRQCIFVGTTNAEHGFLRDTTGNRRFWPVTVPGYNPDYVPAEMKDGAVDDTAITAGSVESVTSAESAPSTESTPSADITPAFFHKRSWELTQADVDQIWAEVLTYYNNKESLILPADLNEEAVKTQRESMETDDREPLVREYLDKLLPENWYNLETTVRINYLNGGEFAGAKMVGTMKRKRVCNMEIWTECFGNSSSKIGRQDSNQIIAMMERIPGWVRSPKKARIKPYGVVPVYIRDPKYKPDKSDVDEYGTDGYGADNDVDEFDDPMD